MTPTSALIGPNRAFDGVFEDLKAISDRLEPMRDECWHPAGPNRDRPTPHRDPNAGPDDVKGIVRDCGLGDERARQAWGEMVDLLHRAEQGASDIMSALRGHESVPVDACRPTSLVDVQACVKRLASRLRALRGIHVIYDGVAPTVPDGIVPRQRASVDSHGVDKPKARWMERQLMGERDRPAGSVFENVRQAAFRAQRVVRQVGSGKPPDVCSQCRSPRSVGQPRKGGLCYACDKRNQRNPLASARVRRTTVKAWRRAKAS